MNRTRRSGIIVITLMTLLLVFLIGCSNVATSLKNPTSHIDTTGLQEAVTIATSALHDLPDYRADNWTLISAQQITIVTDVVWHITFKPTRLLTDDPSKECIGAGGEVFVNINQVTKKTEIRYGE